MSQLYEIFIKRIFFNKPAKVIKAWGNGEREEGKLERGKGKREKWKNGKGKGKEGKRVESLRSLELWSHDFKDGCTESHDFLYNTMLIQFRSNKGNSFNPGRSGKDWSGSLLK
ncbi:MAG: hypothetical protein B6I19_00415 [Bacteroidetes bacterium 4572_114]|nr:MAG: hypothetical protein B6I19_00415 [Bacteroidetes bacterium 4572_114]